METCISVIIPIYNAAATLRAAAESVLSQDVEGLELLLVDDGSTDGTAEVCHALAVQDARVQVLTQKNAGICAARSLPVCTVAVCARLLRYGGGPAGALHPVPYSAVRVRTGT